MSKSRIITISLLVATLVGFAVNINAPSISTLFMRLLITLVITMPILYLTIIMIRSYAHKPTITKTIVGVITIVLVVTMVLLGSKQFSSNQSLCLDVITSSNHFRTNPFTGQCSYGGAQGNSCSKPEPWYYQKDCSTVEKKVQAIRQSSFIKSIEYSCNQYCEKNQTTKFCSDYTRGSSFELPGVNCGQLVTCSTITCKNQ